MKPKTNVQHIKYIMENSRHGALMQAYIIDALTKYSQETIKHEESLRKNMENSFVHPDAWIGCAKELNAYLDKAYS